MVQQTPNDPIADALDLTPVSEDEVISTKAAKPAPPIKSTEQDLEYARGNYLELIEKGRESLEDLMEIARQSQHPRAFEVIATLIKTITDTNDRVVDLQKKAKDILSEPESKKITNNNLFVGSTTELTKILGGNARDILKSK